MPKTAKREPHRPGHSTKEETGGVAAVGEWPPLDAIDLKYPGLQSPRREKYTVPTLIAYSSKHGTTKRYAEDLARECHGEVKLVDLRGEHTVDLDRYDTVIIGSAIYAGQVNKAVKDFCTANLGTLQAKRLGLYICCWHKGEEAEKQLHGVFPAELLQAAVVKEHLGGELDLTKMNLLERMVTRVIVKVRETTSRYSVEAARHFARALQHAEYR